MTAAAPNQKQVEITVYALTELLKTQISPDQKAVFKTALDTVTGLAPTNNPGDHLPIFVTARNGDEDVVGCTCGHTPAKRPRRGSMVMASFNTHLARLGVLRTSANQTARYPSGPFKGMSVFERIDAEGDTYWTR